MREGLERRASSALGVEITIGGLSLERGGLSLRDLRIDAGRRGRIEAEEVDLRVRLLSLARRQEGAITGASLRRVTLVVPLDEAARSWERAGDERSHENGGQARRPAESNAESIAASLNRLGGALRLVAEDATVELERATILGRRGGQSLELLSDLSAGATRSPRGVLYTWGRGRVGEIGGADPEGKGGGELAWTAEVDTEDLHAAATATLDRVPLASFLPILPDLPWHRPERALLTGRFELGRFDLGAAQGEGALPIRGELAITDLALASPRIAEEPVISDVALRAEGTWAPAHRRLELAAATVELDGVRVEVVGRLTPSRIRIEAELPATPCTEALSAVPASVLGEASGFEWEGALAAALALDLDLDSPAETELDLDVDDRCRFTSAPHDARIERFREPFVHPILLADGTYGKLETGPGTLDWTPIDDVSPALIWAVLASEDAGFFRHAGFAPWAIETALRRNLEEGRFAYGASTISMQLAKNLFLVRDKTLARKLREVVLTWWLESQLDKREILALYFNVIEYGPGIYGIRNAARHYFGRLPADLTLGESLFLANLLPAPRTHHRQYEAGEISPRTRAAMNVLLAAMARRGWIDRPTLFHGLAEVQTVRFHPGDGLRAGPSQRAGIGTAPLPWGGRRGEISFR
ncbi:MAG TPA: biosynthetic peptidoglycan transglycosylase [Thermoanaerobaculia bacterium]|nr:biosynthetic peptidoglycan transglycosylase [Thermoanaerobaculia bacterium]